MSVDLKCGMADFPEGMFPLIVSTSEKLIRYLWQDRLDVFKQIALESWSTAGTEFFRQHCTLATEDDALLGVLIAYDGVTYGEISAPTAQIAARHLPDPLARHMVGVLRQSRYLNPAIPSSAYYINYIAVAPEAQGKGVGRALIEAAMEQATGSDCRSVDLDVDATNAAVKFYERLGFTVLTETRVPAIDAALGEDHRKFRMTIEVDRT